MARAVGWLLFFAWCRTVFSAALQNAGANCYFNCWKTPGFCNWCGAGNACCKQGDHDGDPLECRGPLTYQTNGQFHECIVPAFGPGETPPDELTHNYSPATDETKAQCISYFSANDCLWTNKKSCPGQPGGSQGQAEADDSEAYQCCCVNGFWKESATLGDIPSPNQASKQQCEDYTKSHGCGWTAEYNCPNQTAGSKGAAGNQGSLGYKCCCTDELWRLPSSWHNLTSGGTYSTPSPATLVSGAAVSIGSTLAPDQNGLAIVSGGAANSAPVVTVANNGAFGVVTSTVAPLNLAAGVTIAPPVVVTTVTQDLIPGVTEIQVASTTGFSVGDQIVIGQGTSGEEVHRINSFGSIILDTPIVNPHGVGTTVAVKNSAEALIASDDPEFMASHAGTQNIHVLKTMVSSTHQHDTEHRGPIHNAFSENTEKNKKERCTFGICSDLDSNNPDIDNAEMHSHGIAEAAGDHVLPSIIASVNDSTNAVHVQQVDDNGVPVAAPPTLLNTTLAQPIQANQHVLYVASVVGWEIGDQLRIGNVEVSTVVGIKYPNGTSTVAEGSPAAFVENQTVAATVGTATATAAAAAAATAAQNTNTANMANAIVPTVGGRRLLAKSARRLDETSPGTPGTPALMINPPAVQPHPQDTVIVQLQRPPTPVAPAAMRAATTPAPEEASSSWDWRHGVLYGIMLALCCCCIVLGGVGAAFFLGKKKNKKTGTDRENFMKNDFIERQPVYEQVPSQDSVPMAMAAVDVNNDGIADMYVTGVDANRDGIPDVLQQPPPLMAPAPMVPTVPATAPSGVSFPGMPTIGGSTFLNPAAPYGNYQMAPSAYYPNTASVQLGMTGPLTTLPSTGGVV